MEILGAVTAIIVLVIWLQKQIAIWRCLRLARHGDIDRYGSAWIMRKGRDEAIVDGYAISGEAGDPVYEFCVLLNGLSLVSCVADPSRVLKGDPAARRVYDLLCETVLGRERESRITFRTEAEENCLLARLCAGLGE